MIKQIACATTFATTLILNAGVHADVQADERLTGSEFEVLETNYAADHQSSGRKETGGLLGGAALGAAVAGPPGAIVGGIIGAIIGDSIADQAHADHLQASLLQTRRELYALEQERSEWERKYQLALQQNNQNTVTAMNATAPVALNDCCNATVMALHFRSGSSEIEDHYREHLATLVEASRNSAGSVLEITGFADRRGDAQANQALSLERTQSVKKLLARMGVENSRINTIAYGESRPLQPAQDLEADFFDRRVEVRLSDGSGLLISRSED